MSEAKHTPGPWHASRLCRYINTLQNSPIAEMIDRPNRVADAHLFAAAPDLLDACKVAIGHMTGGMDGDWRDCDPVEVLRTAIAKAEAAITTSQRGTE